MIRSLALGRAALAACLSLSACAAGPGAPATNAAPAQSAYGAFLAARYASLINDQDAAAGFYASALKYNPNNPQMLAEGFLSGLLAGSPEAASLAPQLPGNALATLLQGNQAAINGDYAAAAKLFQSLPRDQLATLMVPLLTAWSQFGEGDEPGALNTLGPAFNDNEFGAVYVLNAALIADAAGDTKSATQLYAAISPASPNLRLAQILASWDTRQGQTGQAQAVLAALLAAHPDLGLAMGPLTAQLHQKVITTPVQGMAEAYLTLAGSLSQPQAVFLRTVFLRFALQLRPDLAAARLILANTQVDGDDPQAKPSPVDLRNALATLAPIPPSDPLFGPAALQQANLYAALNEPDQAAAMLGQLLATDPNNVALLAAAGDIRRGANQCAQALPYYQKAIAQTGTPAPTAAWPLYFDRGICEDQTGNWAAAEPDIETALALSPNQPYVLNYLGYSWALRGEKLDQAHAMLNKAASLDPNDGAVLDSLGYIQLRQGDTKGALATLTQATELTPDDAEVNAHLGDAFWQANLPLQAAYQWQRALSLHPDPKLAATLQSQITTHFGP